MSVSLIQYYRNELSKAFGREIPLTDEALANTLITGNMLQHGELTFKDLLPNAEKYAELFYALAYDCYQKNQFEKAHKFFTLLVTYDPKTAKYLKGWGATSELLKKYEEAMVAYFTLATVEPTELSHMLHLAKAFYKLNRPEEAVHCLEGIEKLSKDKLFQSDRPEFKTCVKQAAAFRQFLTKHHKKS